MLSRLGRHDFVVLVAIVFESIFQEGNRNFHWPRFKYPVHIEVVIIIIIITIIVIVSPRPSIELFTPFTDFAGMEPLLYRLQRHHKKIGHDAQRSLRGRSQQAGYGEGGVVLCKKRIDAWL